MALEEEMMQEEQAAPQQGPVQLTDEEEDDLEIAVTMTKHMIDDGGIGIIDQAMNESNDPAQVIGQFLMQLVSQLNESLPDDVTLSKRIYLAKDGWVEQVSDFLQDEYDIPRKVMDRAEIYIATAAERMAQGEAQRLGTTAPGGAPAEQGMQPPQPMEGMA